MKAIIMNKQVLLALGAIVFAGAVVAANTGAFFTDSATASANVFQAGSLNLQISKDNGSSYHNNVNSAWNFSDMAPGGTPSVTSVLLKNTGSVDGMKLGVSASNTPSKTGFDKHVRITQLTLSGSNLLEGGAGATIGDYQEPATCTVTATPGNLVSTVASAAEGSIVCVAAGTYSPGTLSIGTDKITLVGLHDPNGAQAANITGTIGVTGADVTIRGLNITNPGAGYGVTVTGGADGLTIADNVIHDIGTTLTQGSAQAVSVQNGAAGGTGFTITGNRIYNVGSTNLVHGTSGSAKGIYLGDTNSATVALSSVTIENNIIHDIAASGNPWPAGRGAYGVQTNVHGGVTGLVVKNNSIYNLDGLWSHAVGLEGLTTGAQVTYNDIHDLVNHKTSNDSTGVMIEDNAGTSIKVQHNNLPVAFGVIKANSTGSVDARYNWWGDFDPSDQVYTSGPTINTSNYAGGPIAGLIGGTDSNGNGFADLADLEATPITGATPGLNANQVRKLTMGVQVDGPSTDNSFQGASLSTKLTFTLSQI